MTETPAPPVLDDQLTAQLLHQRIIVVGGALDDVAATRVVAQLLLLSARDPRADISLCVSSPGGSVTGGLAVADTIRVIPNEVATLGVGLVAGAGRILLAAGTRGKRRVLPSARIVTDGEQGRWLSATEAVADGLVDEVVEALADVRPQGVVRRVGLA